RAFGRRRVCQPRAPRDLAGGCLLVAHRVVRARDPQKTVGELAATLPVDRTGGLSILPQAIVRGAKGCRTRSADHARAFQNARGAGERARHPPIQARRAVDDARYYTTSLRHWTVGPLPLGEGD